MKNRLAALVFFFAASCGAAQLGDFGQEYPVWSETDPFAITFSTNTAALLTLETAARKAGDSGLSNYVDTAVAGVTASSIGALTNAVRLVSADGTYFQTIDNGTGTVWQVTGPFTNYYVVLSADFLETVENTRPEWTTNSFPFSSAGWTGYRTSGDLFEITRIALGILWTSASPVVPAVCVCAAGGTGTATVYSGQYYSTNLFATFTTAAELAAINATLGGRITAVEAMALTPAQVLGIVNPYQTTVYGSNSITNDAGYGAFLTTNNAVNVNIVAVDPVAGQVIASYLYRVPAYSIDGTATLSHHLSIGSGAGTTSSVATVVQAFAPSGVSLWSNVVATFRMKVGLASSTNIVTSFVLPYVASNGIIKVSIVETLGSTRDVTARTGGVYPMALTVPIVPTVYATQGQVDDKVASTNGTAYNLALTGAVSLNGSTISNWPSGGGGVSASQWLYYDTATNATGKTSYQVYTNALGGALTNFFISSLVPATGQTNVFFEGSCDGCMRWGVALPTPRFGIGSSGAATNVVHDYLTGLDWARKADNVTNSWSGAFAFIVTNLNAESYGGFNDWRMPNINELTSLVSRQYENPCMSGISGLAKGGSGDPFHGLQNVDYWSSTTRIGVTNYAITLSVGSGFYSVGIKQTNARFLAVRGGVPVN